MHRLEHTLGILLLIFAIGCGLWIYRLEPTATTDPNDNTFQYALVERTNVIFDYALKTRNITLLFDHWVPNWAQGYNLPSYYSHIPQIIIVATHKLIPFVSLFTYYHWITYLLLSFFPLSCYLAIRVIGLSPLAAGIGAIAALTISTDGLYGLDPSSFLWRGYGLTSQLYAMMTLPLAISFLVRYFVTDTERSPFSRSWKPALLFLVLTTTGHLGIGIMAIMGSGIIALSPYVFAIGTKSWEKRTTASLWVTAAKLLLLSCGILLLLGYWIVPIVQHGNFHNTSVWDPIWKFNSYGFREVLKQLFNGDLFDFGRFPVLTLLVFIGLAFSLLSFSLSLFPFALLFVVWVLLYFGSTTWGPLLSALPGMSDFHLSRFIVGVHIAGLFLIPLGFEQMSNTIGSWVSYMVYRKKISSPHIRYTNPHIRILLSLTFSCCILFLSLPQTIKYASYNDTLITRGNENATAVQSDASLLLSTLSSKLKAKPGRVFAGRGGSWGKPFRIAETPYYMYLSTYGIPTILWLPETWSPNSDTEQYFSENKPADYTLYNVRYVVTPPDLPKEQIQPFWKPLSASKTWKLYEVETDGYITTGVRPAIVSVDKLTFTNVVRLWIQSGDPHAKLFPELTFSKQYPVNTGLPNFRMVDEVTYKVPDGSLHNLFAEVPKYVGNLSALSNVRITSQTNTADMKFTATVDVPANCTECLVILRQTYHPSWRATIDGKRADTMIVFPFFTAVSVTSPGAHTVAFSYQPSGEKIVLLLLAAAGWTTLIFAFRKNHQ